MVEVVDPGTVPAAGAKAEASHAGSENKNEDDEEGGEEGAWAAAAMLSAKASSAGTQCLASSADRGGNLDVSLAKNAD